MAATRTAMLAAACAAVLTWACGGEGSANPCAGVDCSGHGVCTTDGFWPLCTCDEGWSAVGAACLGGEDAGDVDVPQDADADEAGDADAADEGGEAPVACGDGLVDPTEECDDGNTTDGDGCDGDCTYSCHVATDCNDGEECTTDFCVTRGAGRVCDTAPVDGGTPCDDGNACTTADACDGAGTCVGGFPMPADSPCDDGLFCDGSADLCDSAGHCLPLSLPPCPVDGCVAGCDEAARGCIPASVDVVCRPATGPCDATESCDGASTGCPGDGPSPAGTPCDDGDGCTDGDACDGAGNCYGGWNVC